MAFAGYKVLGNVRSLIAEYASPSFFMKIQIFDTYLFGLLLRDMIEKHQVCVRVIGDINLLPKDVQCSIARVVEFSKNFSR